MGVALVWCQHLKKDFHFTGHSSSTKIFLLNNSSKKWRSKGNEFYKVKRLEQALMCYTKALNSLPLNHAETSSEMALCLGNRSAALFELNVRLKHLKMIKRRLEKVNLAMLSIHIAKLTYIVINSSLN